MLSHQQGKAPACRSTDHRAFLHYMSAKVGKEHGLCRYLFRVCSALAAAAGQAQSPHRLTHHRAREALGSSGLGDPWSLAARDLTSQRSVLC